MKMDHLSNQIVFPRKYFTVHVVHWAFIVLAVPVCAVWNNKNAFAICFIVGFLSSFLFALLPPARSLLNHGKLFCEEAKRLAKSIMIVMIPLTVIFVFGNFLFWCLKGQPSDYQGYCIWNHGFIRAITREQYMILSAIHRAEFLSSLALIRSAVMLKCCCADRIA